MLACGSSMSPESSTGSYSADTAPRKTARLVRVAARKHERELGFAHTGDGLHIRSVRSDLLRPRRHLLQQTVAFAIAQRLVDVAEPARAHDQEPHRLPLPSCRIDGLVEQLAQTHAIGETRERVGQRHAPDRLLGLRGARAGRAASECRTRDRRPYRSAARAPRSRTHRDPRRECSTRRSSRCRRAAAAMQPTRSRASARHRAKVRRSDRSGGRARRSACRCESRCAGRPVSAFVVGPRDVGNREVALLEARVGHRTNRLRSSCSA